MNLKKIASSIFIVLLLAPSLYGDDDWDFFFNNPDLDEIVENTHWDIDRSCSAEAAITLIEDLGIIELLQENLYLRSAFLNKRNPLDYPLIYSDWYHKEQNNLGFYWFYNQTSRMFFSKNSDTINAILALGPGPFLNQLQVIFDNIAMLDPSFAGQMEPIQDLLRLAEQFQVQERRAGLMFNINRTYKRYNLNVKFPLYYLERNYFIGVPEQMAIEELVSALCGNPITRPPGTCANGPTPSTREEIQFQENHLIGDRFGLGDTRVEVDFPLYYSDSFKLRTGFFLTLPTAFPFRRGLKGAAFPKIRNRPCFDLCLLLNAIDDGGNDGNSIEQAAMNFGIAALDTLSSMLLDTPLGNDGHLGLGGVLYTKGRLSSIINRAWTQRIKMKGRISLEYLLPRQETRFFIQNINPEDFSSRDFDDEEQAEQNLQFLQQELTNRIFPFGFKATVHPGFVFRWTSRWMYEGRKWGFHIGSDFWLRSKEKLTNVRAPKSQCRLLNIEAAEKPLAYQNKITGGVCYKIKRPYREWTLSLNADKTYFSQGIGKDFTLSFNIDVYF